MEKKVYVINYNSYWDDGWENVVYGVYSTLEKAKEVLESLYNKEKEYYDFEFDEIIEEKDETHFCIYEDGYYLSNSSDATITEKVIDGD